MECNRELRRTPANIAGWFLRKMKRQFSENKSLSINVIGIIGLPWANNNNHRNTTKKPLWFKFHTLYKK